MSILCYLLAGLHIFLWIVLNISLTNGATPVNITQVNNQVIMERNELLDIRKDVWRDKKKFHLGYRAITRIRVLKIQKQHRRGKKGGERHRWTQCDTMRSKVMSTRVMLNCRSIKSKSTNWGSGYTSG